MSVRDCQLIIQSILPKQIEGAALRKHGGVRDHRIGWRKNRHGEGNRASLRSISRSHAPGTSQRAASQYAVHRNGVDDLGISQVIESGTALCDCGLRYENNFIDNAQIAGILGLCVLAPCESEFIELRCSQERGEMKIRTLPVYSKLADEAEVRQLGLWEKLPVNADGSRWQLSQHQVATYEALAEPS